MKAAKTILQLTSIMVLANLVCLSCAKSTDVQLGCQPIVVNASLFENDQGDEFEFFEDIKVVDDCLEVTIRYGGGCGNIATSLVDSGEINRSKPSGRKLRLILKDNDPCEASITKKISFDLKKIQVMGENELILNIQDWPTPILYNY